MHRGCSYPWLYLIMSFIMYMEEAEMDLKQMSVGGLRSLHDAVRKALAEDDRAPAGEKLFGVREFPDWQRWSDALEAELLERGETFTAVRWDAA